MALPPRESPLWAQMEEDVASGRWPLSAPGGALLPWHGGPGNEARRRVAFRKQVKRVTAKRSWRQVWVLIPCVVGPWVGASYAEAHPHQPIPAGWVYMALAAISLCLLGIGYSVFGRVRFAMSALRYMKQHLPQVPATTVTSPS